MTEETVHEFRRTRSRRAIATYLNRVSKALRRGEPVPADDEQSVLVDPPADAEFEVEIEREDGDISLELELEWEEEEGDLETDVIASKATFEVYEDAADEHRWRLQHRNGNVIADGGEGYASRQKAVQGLESVKENVPGAPVLDQIAGESEPDADPIDSDATVELYEDAEGKPRWRLVHDNGNLIADSGQGYSSKQKARQGLRSVRTNAPGAPVEDVEE